MCLDTGPDVDEASHIDNTSIREVLVRHDIELDERYGRCAGGDTDDRCAASVESSLRTYPKHETEPLPPLGVPPAVGRWVRQHGSPGLACEPGFGHVFGHVFGQFGHVVGHVYRHVLGHVYRRVFGHVHGHVVGHVFGHVYRHVFGHVVGHVLKHVLRHVSGVLRH